MEIEKLVKVQSELKNELKGFYPNFPEQMLTDLSRIVTGNAHHVSKKLNEFSSMEKPAVVNHEEQVICLGTGFDWLHLFNFGIIVNPVDIDLITPIRIQLKVITDNLEKKRIPLKDGVIFMITTSYRNIDHRNHSILKALTLLEIAEKLIQDEFPDLLKKGMQILVGTLNKNTRLFEQVEPDILRRFSKSGYVAPTYEELNKIGKFVLDHNREQYKVFIDPYNIQMRKLYRKEYPTELIALKCMDGRINLPIATEIPMGIFNPYRNLGSKFHFGWKGFFDDVYDSVEFARRSGNNSLIFSTYHYSELDSHLGCAGHNYDTDAAKQNAKNLVDQAEFTFGKGYGLDVGVIMTGFNTDNNSLILHGEHGQTFNVKEYVESKPKEYFMNNALKHILEKESLN